MTHHDDMAMLVVRVRSAHDAAEAEAGGADRVVVVGADDMSPEPGVVESVCAATSVEVRVVLRLRDDYSTSGAEVTRLIGLAHAYHQAGAEGFHMGFLNGMSEVDKGVCEAIVDMQTWGWTFDRAIDAVFDADEAWAAVRELPGVDSILSAGSARGVEQGIDAVIRQAQRTTVPVIVGGILQPEHVPWLARGGITRFFVEEDHVTTPRVQSWRMLIDGQVARQRTARGAASA